MSASSPHAAPMLMRVCADTCQPSPPGCLNRHSGAGPCSQAARCRGVTPPQGGGALQAARGAGEPPPRVSRGEDASLAETPPAPAPAPAASASGSPALAAPARRRAPLAREGPPGSRLCAWAWKTPSCTGRTITTSEYLTSLVLIGHAASLTPY